MKQLPSYIVEVIMNPFIMIVLGCVAQVLDGSSYLI